MENNNHKELSFSNKLKSIPLKENNKQKDKNISTNEEINRMKKLGIILSPTSSLSRNDDKNKNFLSLILTKEKVKNIKKIKLIKCINLNSNLPNISTQKNTPTKNLLLYSFKSSKIISNKPLQKNVSTNTKTVNSIKQTFTESKNKIKKIPISYLFNKSINMSDTNIKNQINTDFYNKTFQKENKKVQNEKGYNSTENKFFRNKNVKLFYAKQKNKYSRKNFEKKKTLHYLNSKNGIYHLSDFNRKLLIKNLQKEKQINKHDNKNSNDIINQIKEHNLFNKIKNENKLMLKQIKNEYDSLNEFKKRYYEKRPNENEFKGFSEIYYNYNKERGKTENIHTNRLITLNWAGNNDLQDIECKEKIEKMNKTKLNNVFINSKGKQILNDDKKNNKKKTYQELTNFCFRANQKVEKLFPDLIGFNLPKILRENKNYTIKLLYDVFIEFKILLKFCILSNNDINIHNEGIDFDTFFNCNTKINQQGKGLSKKIFKTLNNKLEKKYLPWGNYINGMMRMKDPDMNNKMDLFFEILDENGDGSLDYSEVYNLSLVSLQRTLSQNPLDILKKSEKQKMEQKEVIGILAEFFSKMIFSLVNIDIKDDIPIDTLRKKMQEDGEAAEYLKMFLCADNFT